MEKKIKEKGVAIFEGLTISNTAVVKLKFRLRYDDMITSVNLLQGLNSDVTLRAKIPNYDAMSLGVFEIDSINFDKDGNAKITFKSFAQNVELENICMLPTADYIQLMFLAVLELPDTEMEV